MTLQFQLAFSSDILNVSNIHAMLYMMVVCFICICILTHVTLFAGPDKNYSGGDTVRDCILEFIKHFIIN
jgi:hypothetical protein